MEKDVRRQVKRVTSRLSSCFYDADTVMFEPQSYDLKNRIERADHQRSSWLDQTTRAVKNHSWVLFVGPSG